MTNNIKLEACPLCGESNFDDLYQLLQGIEFELTKENYAGVHAMINTLPILNERIQDGL